MENERDGRVGSLLEIIYREGLPTKVTFENKAEWNEQGVSPEMTLEKNHLHTIGLASSKALRQDLAQWGWVWVSSEVVESVSLAHATFIRIKSLFNINWISFISSETLFRDHKSFGLHLSTLWKDSYSCNCEACGYGHWGHSHLVTVSALERLKQIRGNGSLSHVRSHCHGRKKK